MNLFSSLQLGAIGATVVYAVLGIVILVGAVVALNAMFKLDLHRELIEEHNVAAAVVIAGLALAVAIIIGATIAS